VSATTALPADGGRAVGEGDGADSEPLLPPQPVAAANGAAAARPRNGRRPQGWVSPGAAAARVFDRRIEVRPIPAGGSSEDQRRRLAREGVFALVSGILPTDDGHTVGALEAEEILLVGPWTPTGAGPGASRFVFHLFPGAREQAAALVSFAASEPGRRGDETVVAHPDTPEARELGEAVAERCRSAGWSRVERRGFAPGRLDPAALLRSSADEISFLGEGGDLRDLLRAAAARGWASRVFGLGASTARMALDTPPQLGEVFLAFPTMPLPAAAGPPQELLALHSAAPPQPNAPEPRVES